MRGLYDIYALKNAGVDRVLLGTALHSGSIFRDVKPAAKVYYDGVHFDRLGHRLYAAYLADRLRTASARLEPVLERP